MMKFMFVMLLLVYLSNGETKYETGKDSYIDAYIETHNLNKSKIKRKVNLEKEGQSYGSPEMTYDYSPAPYPPSRPVYGSPITYTPEPMFGIPYALTGLIDKIKSKLEVLTLLKILLKLVLFKKFVSFVGIICLLLFIPWLKDSKYGQGGEEEHGDDDVAMRTIKDGPLDDYYLNNITIYILEAIRKYAQINDEREITKGISVRFCIAEELMNYCNDMASEITKSGAKIVCISARDRQDCAEKIQQHEADVGVVDPEDMYIGAKLKNQDFAIFEEIVTLEEPEAEFRYEGVAVIHKDLKLDDSIKSIKGLKSCHTGVGRNVGYKIPITKLKKMGIIGSLIEPGLSPRENELKAFSTLFSKSCIVGNWSPDPKIDKKLSKIVTKYSNLCELCEEPEKCNYPDKFSGYDGALRCLAHNGGQIAWTKVIYVRKFFGLPVGTTPAQASNENPDEYAYLCPDGSRVPVRDYPCRWAARPWQGYMANAAVKPIDELRTKIANLYSVGSKTHASWLQKVLELNEKTMPREQKIISPADYLDKANYTDVIEREYGPPYKTVRFCVTSNDELQKCQAFSRAAFAREVRPRFDCVLKDNIEECLKIIRDNGADIITVDGSYADKARKHFNLKPIVSEMYGSMGNSYYAVAVVRKNSLYKSFADLRGVKSCHTGFGRTAGYNAPLFTLIKQNLIKPDQCPYSNAMAEFFSGGSCMPGVKNPENKVPEITAEKLCSMCGGNVDANDGTSLDSKCNADSTESYYGYSGAFRCLVEGKGDVAFFIPTYYRWQKSRYLAVNLKSEDYELLCPNGGKVPVSDFEQCNLAQVPAHMVVTSNTKTEDDVDEIRNALLQASTFFTKNSHIFKMFGPFRGKNNLLFKDFTSGLVSVNQVSETQQLYSDLLSTINACDELFRKWDLNLVNVQNFGKHDVEKVEIINLLEFADYHLATEYWLVWHIFSISGLSLRAIPTLNSFIICRIRVCATFIQPLTIQKYKGQVMGQNCGLRAAVSRLAPSCGALFCARSLNSSAHHKRSPSSSLLAAARLRRRFSSPDHRDAISTREPHAACGVIRRSMCRSSPQLPHRRPSARRFPAAWHSCGLVKPSTLASRESAFDDLNGCCTRPAAPQRWRQGYVKAEAVRNLPHAARRAAGRSSTTTAVSLRHQTSRSRQP
ncbi:hypothetical protein FQR65_LT18952 [Abscondita terminalis]|nr:hypothetical protein FQR65_LT18952 [Abscondita terminalis]